MKFRSLWLVVVMLAALAFAGVTSAQDIDPCFGLSVDDCAVIDGANANGVGTAQSFRQDQSINFTMSGVPDPATGAVSDITFSQVGGVDIVVNEASLLQFNMSGSYTITGGGMGDSVDLAINFRIVDDILYLENPEAPGEWASLNLVELLNDPTITESLPIDPTGDLSELDEMGMGLPDTESLLGLLDIINLPGLVTYERTDNTFVFTLDLTVLGDLTDEGNEELLDNVVETLSAIDPSAASFVTLVPVLLDVATIQVVQVVNPDLNIVEALQFNADVTINPSLLDPELGPITATLAVDTSIGNLDGVAVIEAPATSEEIPVEGLLDAFMGGLLGGQ